MKRFFLLFAVLSCLTSLACAPAGLISVKTLRPPLLRNAILPYSLKIERFEVPADVPRKFSAHASASYIHYSMDLAAGITRSFTNYLKGSNIFKSVASDDTAPFAPELWMDKMGFFEGGVMKLATEPVWKSERYMTRVQELKDPPKTDLVMRGSVKRFHWEESGSLWTTTLLCVFTLDIYPALGGAINWPTGEAAIEISIIDTKTGKQVASYPPCVVKVREALGIYDNAKDSPSCQLMEAYTRVCEKIISDMERDSKYIARRIKSGISVVEDEAAKKKAAPDKKTPDKTKKESPEKTPADKKAETKKTFLKK